MNKLDKVIEVLLEGVDTKQLWHLVFNKMTNKAKRQMLSEMLNQILGGVNPIEGYMFEEKDVLG